MEGPDPVPRSSTRIQRVQGKVIPFTDPRCCVLCPTTPQNIQHAGVQLLTGGVEALVHPVPPFPQLIPEIPEGSHSQEPWDVFKTQHI